MKEQYIEYIIIYVSTRRCLDSNNSKHDNTNYYNMFSETLDGKEEILKH